MIRPDRHTLRALALVAALVAATIIVYAPVRGYDFVELDDPLYVRENPHVTGGLTAENLVWAFTSQHGGYWIPLTWLSYMADVEFHGVDPGAMHATNLAFHVANTLLLFGLLVSLTGAPGPSIFVAALFGVHPLHVESVAWITERKDVLSTFFWFLGLWAYRWYAASPGWRRYAVVAGCALLGLMAKPMLVTFPFVLLLLDFWPLRRAELSRRALAAWGRLVAEKVPLIALSVAGSALVYFTQQAAGAAPSIQAVPASMRVANAIVSYVEYLRMAVWPRGLAMIYPLPPSYPAWEVGGAAAVLVAVSGLAWWQARRRGYLAVGWLWYLGTLVPVSGLVQVGVQARADRFAYVPLIGVYLAVAWAGAEAASRSRGRRAAAALVGVLVVGAAGVQARQQVSYWRDSATLWTRALETSLGLGEFDAHLALGRIVGEQGRTSEALAHLEAAVALRPDSFDARYALARNLASAGRPSEAIPHLFEVCKTRPENPALHVELGGLLAQTGRLNEAAQEFREALRLRPDVGAVHNNLGAVLARQERFEEAAAHFAEAARLGPDVLTPTLNLGMALVRLGRVADARAVFLEVLRLNPRNETARAAISELPGR